MFTNSSEKMTCLQLYLLFNFKFQALSAGFCGYFTLGRDSVSMCHWCLYSAVILKFEKGLHVFGTWSATGIPRNDQKDF